MNALLRVLFIVLIIAIFGAAILQILLMCDKEVIEV